MAAWPALAAAPKCATSWCPLGRRRSPLQLIWRVRPTHLDHASNILSHKIITVKSFFLTFLFLCAIILPDQDVLHERKGMSDTLLIEAKTQEEFYMRLRRIGAKHVDAVPYTDVVTIRNFEGKFLDIVRYMLRLTARSSVANILYLKGCGSRFADRYEHGPEDVISEKSALSHLTEIRGILASQNMTLSCTGPDGTIEESATELRFITL